MRDRLGRGVIALVLGAALLSLVVPAPLWGLRWLGATCTQRLDHTLVLGGVPIPTSARCVGFYDGAALGYLTLLGLGRSRRQGLPGRTGVAVLSLVSVAFAADGLNSTLLDVAGRGLYPTTTATRLLSGLGFGAALALLSAPLLASLVAGPTGDRRGPIDRGPAAAAAAALLTFGVLLLRQPAALLYPVALLTLLGEIAVPTVALLTLLARWRVRITPLVAAGTLVGALGALGAWAVVLRLSAGWPLAA